MVARRNSFCGPRYPALGWEGCNNLIKKLVVGVMGYCKNEKKTKVISPCKLDKSGEEGVG